MPRLPRSPWTLPAILLILLLTLRCGGTPYQFEYDFRVDFDTYTTFHWGHPKRGFDNQVSSVMHNRIRSAVDKTLASKGLKRETDQSDTELIVAYHAASKGDLTIHRDWYLFSAGGVTETQTFKKGTLVIDIVDTGLEVVIWRGWDSGALSGKDLPQETVDEEVADILSNYPPAEASAASGASE